MRHIPGISPSTSAFHNRMPCIRMILLLLPSVYTLPQLYLRITIVLFISNDLKRESCDINDFIEGCSLVHNIFSDYSISTVAKLPLLL